MSASLKLRVGVAAAGLSVLLLGYAWAQQEQTSNRTRAIDPSASGQSDRTTQPNDTSTARRGEQTFGASTQSRTTNYRGAQAKAGGQNQGIDRYLASCLLAKNQAEVQLSEIVQQKSENPEVKKFAQQMIEDHKKMIDQLQPLAEMQGGASRGASGSLGTRTETERSSSTDTSATRSNPSGLPGESAAGQTIPPSGTTAAAPRLGTSTETSTGVTSDHMAGGGALHQLGQI